MVGRGRGDTKRFSSRAERERKRDYNKSNLHAVSDAGTPRGTEHENILSSVAQSCVARLFHFSRSAAAPPSRGDRMGKLKAKYFL